MYTYFGNLFDYLWVCCLFLLAACWDVTLSLSRQCVTVLGVGIKCSFPLISSVALGASFGSSLVSKQTLLSSLSPYCSFCVFYLSLCSPCVGEDVFAGALSHTALSGEAGTFNVTCAVFSQALPFAAPPWCSSMSVGHLLLRESLRDSYV